MKCLRCGKIVDDNTKVCPNCSFEFEDLKKYKTIKVEVDDDNMNSKDKVITIDNPILTFIFGLLSLLFGLTLLAHGLPIPFIFVILFFLSFSAAFYFSVKPTRVKLKPVRTFGIVMAYIGLAVTLYSLIMALLVFTNIL